MESMSIIANKLGFIIALVLLVSCTSKVDIARDDAISIARDFIENHPVYSRSEIDTINVSVIERDRDFIVAFSTKPGWMGGAATLYINKRDGQIVQVDSYQ